MKNIEFLYLAGKNVLASALSERSEGTSLQLFVHLAQIQAVRNLVS
jgi:hypothetical protein